MAKRKWADEYIEKAQLWDVAAWRHGRKLSKVPSLRGPEGIVHTHKEVADLLSQHFFSKDPLEVELDFTDDPPPRPTRVMAPLDRVLIDSLLSKAATLLRFYWTVRVLWFRDKLNDWFKGSGFLGRIGLSVNSGASMSGVEVQGFWKDQLVIDC